MLMSAPRSQPPARSFRCAMSSFMTACSSCFDELSAGTIPHATAVAIVSASPNHSTARFGWASSFDCETPGIEESSDGRNAWNDHKLRAYLFDPGALVPARQKRQPADLRVLEKVLIRIERRLQRHRREKLCSRKFRTVEAPRGNADNTHVLTVECHGLPENVGIRGEGARPECIAQDDCGRRVGDVTIGRGESRADHWSQLQDIEVVAGNQHALDLLWKLSAERGRPGSRVRRHARECGCRITVGPVLRQREHAPRA